METTNKDVRLAIYKTGLPQWKIAEFLGTNEYSFCKMLRHELSEKEQKELIAQIKKSVEFLG